MLRRSKTAVITKLNNTGLINSTRRNYPGLKLTGFIKTPFNSSKLNTISYSSGILIGGATFGYYTYYGDPLAGGLGCAYFGLSTMLAIQFYYISIPLIGLYSLGQYNRKGYIYKLIHKN